MNAMEFEREKRGRRKRRENAATVLLIFGLILLLVGFCAIMWNGLNPGPVVCLIAGIMALEAVIFEAIREKREDKES